MNKIYKLVWSARSRSYVVTSEAASSRGRASSEVRAVAGAVAVALTGVLSAGQALATPVCEDIVVSSNTSSTVSAVCDAKSITVNANINVPSATALTNVQDNGPFDPANYFNLTSLTVASGFSVSGYQALVLSLAASSGDITNNGTLTGISSGLELSSFTAGLVKNSGTITSDSTGMDVYRSPIAEIRNEATDVINGGNVGLNINQADSTVGLIDNSGTISSGGHGYGYGISVRSAATVNKLVNRSGASISGNIAINIEYANLNELENAGQITGDDIGIFAYGSDISGTLTNEATGVIHGAYAGIDLLFESTVNAIINEGTISGGAIGIDGLEGSVISNGITNSGTISGGQVGINLDAGDGPGASIANGITNSGTISGGDYAIRVNTDFGAALDRIDLIGTNAQLIGDVDAANTEVNVKLGAAFTTTNAFNVSKFTVDSGGTLTLTDAAHTMNGLSVDGITVNQGFFNNGTVVVGVNTIGRANGNYTQSAGGALTVGVDGIDDYGVLSVSGNAVLANGTRLNVNVVDSANLEAGDRIEGVVVAGGTLTVNTASGLTVQDNSVLYKFFADTSRDANALDLLVALDQSPFINNVGAGLTPLGGVAANLDQVLANGVPAALQPVMDILTALPADQLPAAMSQLVPVMTGAGAQAGMSALRSMNKIIQSRVESNQGLSAGNPGADRHMWVRAFGSFGEQSSQDVVSGFRSNANGIVLGGDTAVNDNLRAGFAFTYANTDIDSRGSSGPSSLNVNTYELVHYGSYNLDAATAINYQLDAGLNNVKGVRHILLTSQKADSDFNSLNLHASVGIGRSWSISPQSSFAPSVRLDYTHMKTGAYTETGAGGVNLKVNDSTYKEFMLTADLKGVHNLSEHTKLLGNVSAGYDFSNERSVVSSAFVGGGAVFETKGLKTSPWLYRAGLGLMHDANNTEYTLRYDLERRTSGYTNQTLSARARWAF